jgi:hypothetical protein
MQRRAGFAGEPGRNLTRRTRISESCCFRSERFETTPLARRVRMGRGPLAERDAQVFRARARHSEIGRNTKTCSRTRGSEGGRAERQARRDAAMDAAQAGRERMMTA